MMFNPLRGELKSKVYWIKWFANYGPTLSRLPADTRVKRQATPTKPRSRAVEREIRTREWLIPHRFQEDINPPHRISAPSVTTTSTRRLPWVDLHQQVHP